MRGLVGARLVQYKFDTALLAVETIHSHHRVHTLHAVHAEYRCLELLAIAMCRELEELGIAVAGCESVIGFAMCGEREELGIAVAGCGEQ